MLWACQHRREPQNRRSTLLAFGYTLVRFPPLDGLGLVRTLHSMDQKSIRARQPHFREHVIRHVFRVGRREVPNHIQHKPGICHRRIRLRKPLCERDLKLLAGRLLSQRDMTVVLGSDPVFAAWQL